VTVLSAKVLATTAIVLIGLSGAAWAQQTTPAGKPEQADATTTQDQTLGQAGTDLPLPGEDAGISENVASDAPPAAPATDAPGTAPATAAADATQPALGMATESGSERLRSNSSTTEPFTGSVVGRMSADTLIGMNVIDSDGESVGKVSDLIIGSDDAVQHAIVEVGGFLGFGAKTTAIGLEHATFDQSKGEVTLDISRAEIDAMSAYQRNGNGGFSG
jgi:sporulation protein YlmC with PRC-barrel domain